MRKKADSECTTGKYEIGLYLTKLHFWIMHFPLAHPLFFVSITYREAVFCNTASYSDSAEGTVSMLKELNAQSTFLQRSLAKK